MPKVTQEHAGGVDAVYCCAKCDLIFSFGHAQFHARDTGHLITKQTMADLGIIEWTFESASQQ
jgi:hypothetical protein